MQSRAFWACMDSGLIQHCILAHGDILRTSGGSTPMLRQRMSATDVVFIRSLILHLDTTSSLPPGGSVPTSLCSCRSSQKNMG